MRILLLSHRMPYPPDRGDKIRSFHMLAHLAQRHEVHVACVVDDAADLDRIGELRARCAGVLHTRVHPFPDRLLALRALLRGRPVTLEYFHRDALQRQVDALLDRLAFDAFLCFSSPMAEYLLRSRHWTGSIARARRLVDLIDVDSRKWLAYAERERGPLAWIHRREADLLGFYEAQLAQSFDRVLLVSEQERQLFPDRAALDRVDVVANGVDLEYFRPATGPAAGEPDVPVLVFTGVMDYWPNVDGVRWFVREVLPLVRRQVPNVLLQVVGKRPAPSVRALAHDPGIQVTGQVPDVRQWLAGASACIAPLRIGRGIQNKVLEAMAMGKAVVCTPQALEGLGAEPGRELLVAGTAAGFASAVLDLLARPAKAADMGAAARRRVEADYSWDARLAALDPLLLPGEGVA